MPVDETEALQSENVGFSAYTSNLILPLKKSNPNSLIAFVTVIVVSTSLTVDQPLV